MKRTLRRVSVTVVSVCAIFVLLGLAVLYTLQATWFANRVRQEIVSAVEGTTGGRVEVQSFRYDWRTLTAELGGFALHGTEPPEAPPLFRADSVSVGLRIRSLIKTQVDIASLRLERPEICLLLRADGTSNIPTPKGRDEKNQLMERLLSLKVRHFELHHGAIRTNLQRLPLELQGEKLTAVFKYDFAASRYLISLSSHPLRIDSSQCRFLSGDLDAQLQVGKDQLSLQSVELRSTDSTVHGSGTLLHFAQPILDLRIDGRLPAAEAATLLNAPELHAGQIGINAALHYDPSTNFSFDGRVVGSALAYRSPQLTFSNASLASRFSGTLEKVKFAELSISGYGGRLMGEATLAQRRNFEFDGRIDHLDIRELGRWHHGPPLAWSGVAHGPLHIEGTLAQNFRDLTARGELQIAPAPGGIPISGDLDASYKRAGEVIEVRSSDLHLPNSHISVAGTIGATLQLLVESTNLDDLQPAFSLIATKNKSFVFPFALDKGKLDFDGTVAGPLTSPRIDGNLALAHFQMHGQVWDQLQTTLQLSANQLDFKSLAIDQGALHATGNGRIALANWAIENQSPITVQAQFKGVDVAKTMSLYWGTGMPVHQGIASGSLKLAGSFSALYGDGRVTVDHFDAFGERLNHVQVAATFNGDGLQITRGRIETGPALVSFSGEYRHMAGLWTDGQAQININSNDFPLATFAAARRYEPGLQAQVEMHGKLGAHITRDHLEPTDADGTVMLRNVSIEGNRYGDVTLSAVTHGRFINTKFSGDLEATQLSGTAQAQLIPGTPIKGEMHMNRIDVPTVAALLHSGAHQPLPVAGSLQGQLTFEGSLDKLDRLRSNIRIDEVKLQPVIPTKARGKSNALTYRNSGPIVLEAAGGVATIRSFQLEGKDTSFTLMGSIPYRGQGSMNVRAEGSLDLAFFQLFDPGVRTSGASRLSASITGDIKNPAVTGTLDLNNGSLFLNNFPNGLTDVNGSVKFERDRATIQRLTAHSGGGDLSLTGFVSFANGGPLVYRLEANADNLRVRYAGGISVTANSRLRLTGTTKSSLLSGAIQVSRVAFNPSTDVGALLGSGNVAAASATNSTNFIGGVHLDVRIESVPGLQLSTTLSQDVEAQVDLRLRGTPDHPVLLGSVSANQGDVKVFGTKYTINRGEVNFVNPIKVEPVLDLDLQTQTRGITVDITVAGTLNKLNINYRSDPPLQPRDIVALLTVGRTPDVAANISNVQGTNEITALQSSANTVLGQAISPTSNRLSKLFGITSIKIDPLVQGITNTPQSRLTIEQQMSRDITVTYVTNLSQTSEQIFRLEWALSRQYSVIALRDDNGEFGIDIQYKKRFR